MFPVNYVGINHVLLNWSPLMAETNTSVVVGYFMNWLAVLMKMATLKMRVKLLLKVSCDA